MTVSSGPLALVVLMSEVRDARRSVRALRVGKVDPDLLLRARELLLLAMENYAAELVSRRLPIPPTLRDDLRLQRDIHSRREASPQVRYTHTKGD
ncbi:hypothetical protein [Terracoccus luteus]|uniref:Uncharacterized protein n=1 Tax=Terracoccus luteus TaxID=53356 RepID=A0A839PWV2_9MICO|nr:hypothetical protein [Terracoccus luteus]MBB2986505.1 hypothetical protein [Terracoccus luteus]MCP2171906.1 hypothetical protein [Terracoccus luteus]